MLNGCSFIVYIKTDDMYEDIAAVVETKFDTSNYELDISFKKEKNNKVIGSMKNELEGKNHDKICKNKKKLIIT